MQEFFFSQKLNHSDFSTSESFQQVYWQTDEYAVPDGPGLVFLADDSACDVNDQQLNPSLLELAAQLRATLIFYFPRNSNQYQEPTDPALTTRENVLEDIRQFVRYVRMVNNFQSLVLAGFDQFGDVAALAGASYANLISSTVSVQQPGIDGVEALLAGLDGARALALYANMRRLPPWGLAPGAGQRVLVEAEELATPPAQRAEFACQVFGDRFGLAGFAQLCRGLGLGAAPDIPGRAGSDDRDIAGRPGQTGGLGAFVFEGHRGAGRLCGDWAGMQFDATAAAAAVRGWLEVRGLLQE